MNPALKIFAAAAALQSAAISVSACCAVSRAGSVVNADQTVIMIWDEASQRQHFIRQADFRTNAADVGFIVPSPSRPELAAAGDAAFLKLATITAPEIRQGLSIPIGCSAMPAVVSAGVTVVEEKRVAGYDAAVLKAGSGQALADWLKAHGYPVSPEVAAWSQPYLTGDWHFTALKFAAGESREEVRASALRISFRTDRPLFPYREPESSRAAASLGISDRLLRIYFISDSRYRGQFPDGKRWSGRTVWSGNITALRNDLLSELRIAEKDTPRTWWLTEFEDHWPYQTAPGDVYFVRDGHSKTKRPAISRTGPQDAALLAIVGLTMLRPLQRRRAMQAKAHR